MPRSSACWPLSSRDNTSLSSARRVAGGGSYGLAQLDLDRLCQCFQSNSAQFGHRAKLVGELLGQRHRRDRLSYLALHPEQRDAKPWQRGDAERPLRHADVDFKTV